MRLIAVLCTVLAAVFPAVAAEPYGTGTLLVVNREGGSISFFDMERAAEMARVPVGERIPHEAAVSPDGKLAMTSQYGGGNNRGQIVIVMDVEKGAITGTIDLGPKSRPHGMVFLPDNRRALVTMEDSDALALVDAVALKVLKVYPTGGRESHMVRLSPDGSRAYVTSRLGDGTLSVIYLTEDRAPTVIVTGKGAEGIAITHDGKEVWVANRLEGTLSVVDTEKLAIVATVKSQPFPARVAISPKGRVAVPNGMSGQNVVSYFQVFDAASRKLLREVNLSDPSQAEGPSGFGLVAVGEQAVLTDRSRNRILVFNLDDLSSSPRVLPMGHDDPDGASWSPLRVKAPGG